MALITKTKVALVTASSAGLGAEIARAFAPDFRVVINYTNNEPRAMMTLKSLYETLDRSMQPGLPNDGASLPQCFHCIRADATSREDIARLVKETISTMGRLDVVVSNTGWTRMTKFSALDENVVEEDWDRCFSANVKAHLWLMHQVKPWLEETEGTFITTASTAGMKPSGSSLAYSVTKAAQIHLARSLAVICSPRVRVNSISPGLMLTDWGMQFTEEKRESVKNNTKLKRLITVEDVADQVRTLALNKSMTGQNICVDSGATI